MLSVIKCFNFYFPLSQFSNLINFCLVYFCWLIMNICSCTFFTVRWDIKTATVIYGQSATLSCNGNGCTPLSIRKWIGGPTNGVLCFNNYCSNQTKYQLMYNKSQPSFDLMIKGFNFTDANCTYTCACGFYQYTHMLQMDEIDFICKI